MKKIQMDFFAGIFTGSIQRMWMAFVCGWDVSAKSLCVEWTAPSADMALESVSFKGTTLGTESIEI